MAEQHARLEYISRLRTRAALSTEHSETILAAGKDANNQTKAVTGEHATAALESLAAVQDSRRTHQNVTSLRVDLVPIGDLQKPEAMMGLPGGAELAAEDAFLTFWGVWFVAAASCRFKRPLRRKRAVDAIRAKVLHDEIAKRKGQELQHLSALDHNLGRMTTAFLQKALHQSEAVKKKSRESSLRRLEANGFVPSVARVDISQFRPPQPLEMKRITQPQYDSQRSIRDGAASSPRVPQLPLTGGSSTSRPSTRGSSFETKMQVRGLEGTLAKVLDGTSVARGLVRRVSPTQLAQYMFSGVPAVAKPSTANSKAGPPNTGGLTPVAGQPQRDEAVASNSSSRAATPRAPPPPLPPQAQPVILQPSKPMKPMLSPEALLSVDRASPLQSNPHSTAFPASRTKATNNPPPATSTTDDDNLTSVMQRDRANRGRRKSTIFQPKGNTTMLLHEADFFDDPAVSKETKTMIDNPMGHAHAPGSVGYALSKRFDKNAFFEHTLRKLKEVDGLRRSALELKRQYLEYHLHATQDDPLLSCRDMMKGLKAYIQANHRQIMVNGDHEHRTGWFYRFYEGMIARCEYSDIESLLTLMEKQLFDPDCRLGQHAYSQLIAEATQAMLLSPSVQFFLCRAAVAYGVPYLSFREVLELNHVPYLLLGDGSSFKLLS